MLLYYRVKIFYKLGNEFITYKNKRNKIKKYQKYTYYWNTCWNRKRQR